MVGIHSDYESNHHQPGEVSSRQRVKAQKYRQRGIQTGRGTPHHTAPHSERHSHIYTDTDRRTDKSRQKESIDISIGNG